MKIRSRGHYIEKLKELNELKAMSCDGTRGIIIEGAVSDIQGELGAYEREQFPPAPVVMDRVKKAAPKPRSRRIGRKSAS